jgi:hypothetical protein
MKKYLFIGLAIFICLFITAVITYLNDGFTRYNYYGELAFTDNGHAIFKDNKPLITSKTFRWPWELKIVEHYSPLVDNKKLYFDFGEYYIDVSSELQPNNTPSD